jgi:transcriptional regulator of arginine metabolism
MRGCSTRRCSLETLHTYARTMQLPKGERHRLIESVVSRNIRELRLEKTHDQFGRPRYVLPQAMRRNDPAEALTSVLAQFGRMVTAAGNIVVLQSELGAAPAIARALDELGHGRVVGTLAGDDTVLVVAPSERDARALARELSAILS